MVNYNLKDIEPSKECIEEQINVCLKNDRFARTLLWLVLKFEKVDLIYANDLQMFLNIDKTGAFRILEKFVGWGFLKRSKTGNMVEYMPVLNNKENILKKYLSKAKLNLGMKK